MTSYVLDTNIISFLVEGRRQIATKLREVSSDADIIGCPIVWHEVLRGLLAKDAKAKLPYFDMLFESFLWSDFTQDDWQLAARLWVQRRQQGIPIGDADLFIAAFTLNRNAILVTDNEKDFVNLGLRMENWLI